MGAELAPNRQATGGRGVGSALAAAAGQVAKVDRAAAERAAAAYAVTPAPVSPALPQPTQAGAANG